MYSSLTFFISNLPDTNNPRSSVDFCPCILAPCFSSCYVFSLSVGTDGVEFTMWIDEAGLNLTVKLNLPSARIKACATTNSLAH